MKVYSLADLQIIVETEMTWRIREISDYKIAFKGQSGASKRAQARAGIPLLYAHWEGYAKNCTTAYVQFVAAKRKKLEALGSGYWTSMMKPSIDQLAARPYDKKSQMALVDVVRNAGERRFGGKTETIVDTRSNLSFSVLEEIGEIAAINIRILASEQSFIDKILLDRRNNIAHGQNIQVEESDFVDVADRTISIMRAYGNCVIDAAQVL